MPSDEEVKYALSILQKRQGELSEEDSRLKDGFDMVPFQRSDVPAVSQQVPPNIQNLAQSFNLTQKQKENVEAIIVGGGTAMARKMLGKYIGTGLASGFGGVLTDYLVTKLKGGK